MFFISVIRDFMLQQLNKRSVFAYEKCTLYLRRDILFFFFVGLLLSLGKPYEKGWYEVTHFSYRRPQKCFNMNFQMTVLIRLIHFGNLFCSINNSFHFYLSCITFLHMMNTQKNILVSHKGSSWQLLGQLHLEGIICLLIREATVSIQMQDSMMSAESFRLNL